MLEGQILDPGEFPWQDSETHVVALEAKKWLHKMVEKITEHELGNAITAIQGTAEQEEHLARIKELEQQMHDQEKDKSTP